MKAISLRWSALLGALLLAPAVLAQDEDAAEEVAEESEEAAEETAESVESAGASASAELSRTTSGKGYGTAGCGLGSMIFEPDSGFTQVFAATTNGSFGTQTFGITSGTSNCADTSGGSASAKAFVETNRTALAKDIARGQGETIDSLSRLGGCADPSAVGASLQKRFDVVFPRAGMSDSDVGESVLRALKADGSLRCGRLI